MDNLKNIKTYKDFEQQVDKEITNQAESFVRLGYLLKIARDTEILKDSGYSTVAEFAEKRYGLTKDVTSRYININNRFSQDGYSEYLAEQYKGFGYSKLAIMLTLPDSVADALTPQMSKNEIIDVQKEVKQEQQITPLEVMTEQQRPGQQELKTDLQKFLHQYGYDNRENVSELVMATEGEDYIERIMDILAPSGIAMISVRIPGRGKMMLSIKGKDEKLTLIDIRQDEKFDWLWEDLREDILYVYQEGTEEAWERIYGEQFKELEKKVEEENSENKEREIADDKKSDETEKNDKDIQGGVEEPTILKIKAVTEEQKDKLFKSWFENVSKEKIEAACKQMEHMRFNELINVTPKKLFLLVQTSQVNTEEIIENGQVFTKVSTEDCVGEFSIQDFQKRFNREYLEPYKRKQQKQEEQEKKGVAPVQQEEGTPEEQIPGQKEINDYPEVLPDDGYNDGYKSVALRALPGDTLYFIDNAMKEPRIKEGKVIRITIGERLIPYICVESNIKRETIVETFNQRDDWGVRLFKTQEAAERMRT